MAPNKSPLSKSGAITNSVATAPGSVFALASSTTVERRPFLECLEADPDVARALAPEALKACFDPAFYLRHVDEVFRRVGLR